MLNHKDFYKTNNTYTSILESRQIDAYSKYIKYLGDYGVNILDVGCGVGTALDGIKKDVNKYGIEISETSVYKAKQKGLRCSIYDGKTIPFSDEYFDAVGSYNVLEHVDGPIEFLGEQLRVLKNGGHLIIACPNFLSISNNYHWHTTGLYNKIKNILGIVKKTVAKNYYFEKMDPVARPEFKSDDDACNVTNPIDILKWARDNRMKTIYWSSSSVNRTGIMNYLDKGLFKLFFGSGFFVFQKE